MLLGVALCQHYSTHPGPRRLWLKGIPLSFCLRVLRLVVAREHTHQAFVHVHIASHTPQIELLPATEQLRELTLKPLRRPASESSSRAPSRGSI